MIRLVEVLFSKEVKTYLVFGVLTTAVGYMAYFLFRINISGGTIIPNVLSWICAVAFAYVTNSKWVFRERAGSLASAIKFVSARVVTLIADIAIMYLLVDMMAPVGQVYEMIAKAMDMVVVIVLNYVFSKFWVFAKGAKNDETNEKIKTWRRKKADDN